MKHSSGVVMRVDESPHVPKFVIHIAPVHLCAYAVVKQIRSFHHYISMGFILVANACEHRCSIHLIIINHSRVGIYIEIHKFSICGARSIIEVSPLAHLVSVVIELSCACHHWNHSRHDNQRYCNYYSFFHHISPESTSIRVYK